MGIKMSLEDSQEQANTTKSSCENMLNYISDVKNVIAIINNEISQNMKGKGIKSLTNFLSELIIPYIDSIALVIHEIDESIGKLPTKYTDDVDTKSWSEEELQQKIDNYNDKVDHLQNILFDNDIKFNDSQKTKDAKKEITEKTQHSLEAAMLSAEKYYEILDHLREYDNNSTTVFNSISELKKISHQGQIGITGGYNSKEKKYSLPKNNKEWQKSVSNNVSNEIADDIEENENYADTTLYKYLKTDYLDKTPAGFAIIGSLFKAHGYVLNKSSKQPIKSDYQDRLLNDIKAQGNKSSKVGSVLTKEAKNLEALNSILLPINYIAQIESGATPGEAITDIGKDLVIGETSELALVGMAILFSAEYSEEAIIVWTAGLSILLESVSNYLYKHSDTYRKGYDGVAKTIDKGHKKYKDSKKINEYTRRKTDEIIDEYNVDTSKLPNANNQATYYDKYGGGQ